MTFRLPDSFVDGYAATAPQWGYESGPNSLGEITYLRTYSRRKPDGTNESWAETVRRVVEGTYEIQRRHTSKNNREWSEKKAIESAMDMYDRMYNMKFLPPGRGLWMMGTDYVMDRDNGAPLNNCAFISTKELHNGSSYPFTFLMDMSMLGVGVGFDTKGAGAPVKGLNTELGHEGWEIPDSREGWVESVGILIDSYLQGRQPVSFDYAGIRPAGSPINGFGGTASGPAPLIKLHNRIRDVMKGAAKRGHLTSRDIVDIQNMIGACVVAGNVRRSAELALGEVSDTEFLNLKNYELNPERVDWAWASNNSVVVRDGDEVDYAAIAERIADNGEPGLVYLDVARKFGRLGKEADYGDMEAEGTNPCAEQILESGELCTLVEVFPTRCDDIVDFLRTLKVAYLYAKTVTLLETHDERTNKVMRKNRRIGTSVSGVVQFINKHNKDVLEQWLEAGYGYIGNLDRKYSGWLGVEESKRKTTVKPSGTVSILAGSTAGVHYPVADYAIRRIRVQADHPLVGMCRKAGYEVEPDKYSDNTEVISFPIKGEGLPTEYDVSIFDKAEVATFMAEHWSDNAVSATVTFQPGEESYIETVLRENEGKWKTVSFLPLDTGAYEQMPVEPISEERYNELVANLTRIDFSEYYGTDGVMSKFCDGDSCEISFGTLETV